MPHALIIEDVPLSAEVLQRLLTLHGVSSTTIFEPRDAVTFLNPQVTLVFLDLEMPKMSGYNN